MITHMGMELGTPALLAIGLVFGLGIGLAVGLWKQHPTTTVPSPERRDHQYHDCPGCGRRLVQARTYQQSYRFFNARPEKIEGPPEYPKLSHGNQDYVALMERNAEAVRRVKLNNELWVFDPWNKGAMVPYWHQPTSSGEGLLEHFCALGMDKRPDHLNPQERIPWRTPSAKSSAA